MHGIKRKINDSKVLKDYFINNYNEVYEFIINNYINLNTQKTYLSALVVFLKKNNIEHTNIKNKLTELFTIVKEQTYNQEEIISVKKRDNLINHKAYLKCYNENKHKLHITDLLIVSLYILHPPRRIKDYYLLKLQNGHNRIFYENNDMFIELNDYKTSKKYGTYKCKIQDDLKQIIEEYISTYDMKENEFFFDYTNSCSFTVRLKKINHILTGKKLSLNDLRHIYISDFLQTNPSIKQKTELAKQMAHSVSTQATYNYRNL